MREYQQPLEYNRGTCVKNGMNLVRRSSFQIGDIRVFTGSGDQGCYYFGGSILPLGNRLPLNPISGRLFLHIVTRSNRAVTYYYHPVKSNMYTSHRLLIIRWYNFLGYNYRIQYV